MRRMASQLFLLVVVVMFAAYPGLVTPQALGGWILPLGFCAVISSVIIACFLRRAYERREQAKVEFFTKAKVERRLAKFVHPEQEPQRTEDEPAFGVTIAAPHDEPGYDIISTTF